MSGNMSQKLDGSVNFAEAVELVAHDVEQEAVAWWNGIHEMNCVSLVEFEYGNIGIELSF
ncbi:hypothetical protein D3C72_2474170 [compost metagenome]